jgi:hypothetical protein
VKAAVGKDRVLEVDFTASTRRVMLTLRTRPVAAAGGLDEEVKRVADALVSNLLEGHRAELAERRLAVEPTSIPATAGPISGSSSASAPTTSSVPGSAARRPWPSPLPSPRP